MRVEKKRLARSFFFIAFEFNMGKVGGARRW
jgi:hypothetical protein